MLSVMPLIFRHTKNGVTQVIATNVFSSVTDISLLEKIFSKGMSELFYVFLFKVGEVYSMITGKSQHKAPRGKHTAVPIM